MFNCECVNLTLLQCRITCCHTYSTLHHIYTHSYHQEEDWTFSFSHNYIYIHSTRQICIRVHYKRLSMKFVQFLLNIQRKIYKKYNIVQMFNWNPTLFITRYSEVEWVFSITLKQSPHTTLTLPSLQLNREVFNYCDFLCTFLLSTILVLHQEQLPHIIDYICLCFFTHKK